MARIVCDGDSGDMSVSFVDYTGITPVVIKTSEGGVMKESVYRFTANHKNPIDLPRIMRENEGKNVIVIDIGKSVAVLMREEYYRFVKHAGFELPDGLTTASLASLAGVCHEVVFRDGFYRGKFASKFGDLSGFVVDFGTNVARCRSEVLPAIRKLPPMPKPTKVKVIAFE